METRGATNDAGMQVAPDGVRKGEWLRAPRLLSLHKLNPSFPHWPPRNAFLLPAGLIPLSGDSKHPGQISLPSAHGQSSFDNSLIKSSCEIDLNGASTAQQVWPSLLLHCISTSLTLALWASASWPCCSSSNIMHSLWPQGLCTCTSSLLPGRVSPFPS